MIKVPDHVRKVKGRNYTSELPVHRRDVVDAMKGVGDRPQATVYCTGERDLSENYAPGLHGINGREVGILREKGARLCNRRNARPPPGKKQVWVQSEVATNPPLAFMSPVDGLRVPTEVS